MIKLMRDNIRMYCICALSVLLVLSTIACQPQPPPIADRSYLLMRNGVDRKKPCLIAKFATIPVKVFNNVPVVPVLVNGVRTFGILDTGLDGTVLTPSLAAAAKLSVDPKLRLRRGYGVAGGFDAAIVQANTLQIGGLKLLRPPATPVFDFVNSKQQVVGALVGLNAIDHFDWDVDFRREQMTSYRTENCQDVDPLWDTKSTGLPLTRGTNKKFSVIANMLALSTNVTIPVAFDGGILNAVFDTGATRTYLTREGAHKAGIINAELDNDPIDEIVAINGKKQKVRRHNVAELIVGEDIVHAFPVMVAEHLNRDNEFDMILGMDWIAKHRIWLSFSTDSVYIDSGEKKPPNWSPSPTLPQ